MVRTSGRGGAEGEIRRRWMHEGLAEVGCLAGPLVGPCRPDGCLRRPWRFEVPAAPLQHRWENAVAETSYSVDKD